MTAEDVIKETIKHNGGSIKISDFITIALYHPKYGYYQTKNPFGVGGDFVTSPQISSIFSEIFGLFFGYQYKKHFTSSQKLHFIELGAGNGFFMRDALTATSKIQGFNSDVAVHVVEVSDFLIAEQKKNLAQFTDSVDITWYKDLTACLDVIDDDEENVIFVFANEFFDAFPINQYVKNDNELHEIVVSEINDKLGFVQIPCEIGNIEQYLQISGFTFADIPENGIIELSKPSLVAYSEICAKLTKNQGCFVAIDYGYTENKFVSTLQALKKHESVNVFDHIAAADITYLVNFDILSKISKTYTLTTYPVVTQGEFLKSVGIVERTKIAIEKESDEAKKYMIDQATTRLISPNQMGDLFKVLIVENFE